ncbi:hypothetical protein D6779_09560, partial [Candidatus Parcubacteria bacterium]
MGRTGPTPQPRFDRLTAPPSNWKGESGSESEAARCKMKKENIITGQKVHPQKQQRARELRRAMTPA